LRSALLAESIDAKDRGKAFGFHRALDTVGAIVGPLIAAGLMVLLQPYAVDNPTMPFRIVFLLTTVPGLGATIIFIAMVTEKRRPANHQRKFTASVRALPNAFRRFLVGVGVFGAGDFSHTLLILAATQLLAGSHGPIVAAQIAALLYALRNACHTAISYPVGALSDRIGRRGLLAAGYFLGSATMVGFIVAFMTQTESIVWLSVLFAMAGVYISVEEALEGVLTADLVPDESLRGTAYGVMGTVNGVGDFLSSVVVGLLWTYSPEIGFGFAATMMFLGALLIVRVR
jgi:MFS family permease